MKQPYESYDSRGPFPDEQESEEPPVNKSELLEQQVPEKPKSSKSSKNEKKKTGDASRPKIANSRKRETNLNPQCNEDIQLEELLNQYKLL